MKNRTSPLESWGTVAIAIAPLIVILGLLAFRSRDFNAYREFVTESGPIENGTFIMYAAASITAFVIAWRFKGEGQGLFRLLYSTLAAGLLFIAGEEVAWGQNLFQFESPEFFEANNSHGETGIHNLGWVNLLLNPVFTVVSRLGAFAGLLLSRVRGPLKAMVPLVAPGKTLFLYFFLAFCFYAHLGYVAPALGRLFGPEFDLRRGKNYSRDGEPGVYGWEQESFEMLLAAGFLLFTLTNFWRQYSGQYATLDVRSIFRRPLRAPLAFDTDSREP